MKKSAAFIFAALLLTGGLASQSYSPIVQKDNTMSLPDIPGYYTLLCDFHMHTVFSDGVVWPRVRVQEALAEGLHAISITDHVEYSPKYIEDNHQVGYDMAMQAAKNKPLIIVPGGEISASRDHFNALFLTDQNEKELESKVPEERIRAANRQGAFVFWNHPGWGPRTSDGHAPWDENFINLMKEDQIQGIEVCNGSGYWDNALEMCLKYDLAVMGTSDIHGVSHYSLLPDQHRTVTLVFSKEKTADGIEESLKNRKTAVWQGNHLIGKKEYLEPLFLACLKTDASYQGESSKLRVTLTNQSDIDFHCENLGDYTFYNATHFFTLKAKQKTTLIVKTKEQLPDLLIHIRVLNAITAPKTSMKTAIPVMIN